MESPSAALHSGGSPWKGLLITAAVVGTWIQSASPQSSKMKVEPSPPYGMVGGNITLSILGLSKEPRSYTWFRKTTDDSNRIVTYNVRTGQQTPAKGREIVFPNGTLLITNLTLSDSDEYIVEIFSTIHGLRNYQLSLLRVHLEVYELHKGYWETLDQEGRLNQIRSLVRFWKIFTGYKTQILLHRAWAPPLLFLKSHQRVRIRYVHREGPGLPKGPREGSKCWWRMDFLLLIRAGTGTGPGWREVETGFREGRVLLVPTCILACQ
uniref:Immunoglobulin domain-containing protein n=1 Tax=Vombatus ursinus TaxID=29139 RepID=A0A4X2LJ87_VOMUR